MKEYRTIKLDVADGVAKLSLSRPDRLNAMTHEMGYELLDAAERVTSLGARVLLFAGEGRAFCAGAELADETGEPSIAEDMGETLELCFNPFIERLHALPIPIVAAVNGPAAGAGCSLALSADFVIAARSAYFLLAFVNIGLVPDGGLTWILPRLIGQARATEMMMLGGRLSAEQALEWGLIYKVVDNEELATTAMDLAATLAAGPTRAYELIRKGIRAAQGGSLSDNLRLERLHQKIAGQSDDFKEGVDAFLGKRKARFAGR
jgi:2-(1,2-epoxy-1,2-dihydrophenyl)acetyl-CoA isomerase